MKNPHAAKAFQVFMSGAFYRSNVNKLAAQLNADSLSGIERALSVGKERGHIRSDLDPKIWAIIYLSEIRGVVQQWLVDPKHIALGPIVQEVMTAIQLCVKPDWLKLVGCLASCGAASQRVVDTWSNDGHATNRKLQRKQAKSTKRQQNAEDIPQRRPDRDCRPYRLPPCRRWAGNFGSRIGADNYETFCSTLKAAGLKVHSKEYTGKGHLKVCQLVNGQPRCMIIGKKSSRRAQYPSASPSHVASS
jgi:hypothetical protein